MNCDYGYGKLQGINGSEYWIKNFPVVLLKNSQSCEQRSKMELDLSSIETLQLTKCSQQPNLIAILSYDYSQQQFYLLNGCDVGVDGKVYKGHPGLEEAARLLAKDKQQARHTLCQQQQFSKTKILLEDLSRLQILCGKCEMPHVFFFLLPRPVGEKNEDFSIKLVGSSQQLNQQKNYLNPRNKIPDMELGQKWSYEEKEVLKRGILSYGYGRWEKLRRERLRGKERKELIAFANAFLRCLVDNLSQECSELQNFLLGIVEEQADDLYIAPSNKDWETVGQSARAVPWARRIQLLFRIRVLIKKFKRKQWSEHQGQVNWSTLLNFIPDQVLMGQRPSVWWSRQHDIDLLRGIYRYGYANYTEIRECPDYSFYQQEQNNIYNDFPSSDNSTRRLKKLMAAIMRIENEKGRLNFEMEQHMDNSLEGWSKQEVSLLFQFLNCYGIPINHDAKTNWVEFKERFQAFVQTHHLQVNKPQTQIEKIVCYVRSRCNQIIHQKQSTQHTLKHTNIQHNKNDDQHKQSQHEEQQHSQQQQQEQQQEQQQQQQEDNKSQAELLEITYDEAFKFTRTTNILHLLRKSVINKEDLVSKYLDQLVEKHEEMSQKEKNWEIFSTNRESVQQMDSVLVKTVIEHGLDCYQYLKDEEGWKGVEEDLFKKRLEMVLECLRQMIQVNSLKQRKVYPKDTEDRAKKKVKVEIRRDEQGQVLFPIQINNSLRLLHTGVVSTNPNYHSEHNLFPIGFKSVRLYNSIFKKGVKCEYLNEILEGQDKKPLYRVTCSEDPNNPILRDSSTGCWVHICQKVNQLQDHKKEKVTISGTERFGLLEPNINKLLEELPNSDMCYKYTFKYRQSVQP